MYSNIRKNPHQYVLIRVGSVNIVHRSSCWYAGVERLPGSWLPHVLGSAAVIFQDSRDRSLAMDAQIGSRAEEIARELGRISSETAAAETLIRGGDGVLHPMEHFNSSGGFNGTGW